MNGYRAPGAGGIGRRVPRLLSVALAASFGAALAQQAPAPAAPAAAASPAPAPLAPAPEPVFDIKGFQVTGDNPLGDAETARILQPFQRSGATMNTLQQATSALETALRNRGYGLHRVALPPQEIGDTVRLEIVTFTISKVEIEGRTIYDEDNIRRTLPELKEGTTPNFRRLAIQTAIANENPNKQVQLGIREGDEPDKIDATLTVRELRPWTFGVSGSNAGSKASGRDRITVSGGHTNLFNRDHQFNAAYTTSIEQTSDVSQMGLTYRVPLYELGGVIGASFTRSTVIGNFGIFSSTGAGRTMGLNYTAYLPPEGGRRTYVLFGIDDKVFNASKINDVVVPGALDRRSRPIVVGYNAKIESDTATWGYDFNVAMNTGTGTGNDLAAYRSEDVRVTRVNWKAVRGGFNYAAPFNEDWLVSFRVLYQYSPDVLISGEQFGIGGTGSVRGTKTERPVSGDKGVSGVMEVTTPELGGGIRMVGFLDAGWLANNNPNGLNKPSSDRLLGYGLGLRFAVGSFLMSADWGRLLLGSRVPLTVNTASPQRGDSKLYVNAALRF
ncbi:MAG TPA: ShlB/FhaC/HecB family hemolysin secretion/activation protein [Ramlibacter sp.]|nr:ShlB/FhaC/HecB family hemolysin secretion/activation protein [Ramlibacter sp.]